MIGREQIATYTVSDHITTFYHLAIQSSGDAICSEGKLWEVFDINNEVVVMFHDHK